MTIKATQLININHQITNLKKIKKIIITMLQKIKK